MKKSLMFFLSLLLFVLGLLIMLQASDLNPLLASEYYKEKIYSHLYVQTGPDIKYNLLLLFLYLGIGGTLCGLAYRSMTKHTKTKKLAV